MGEFLSSRSTQNNMQAFLLASMLAAAFAAPSAEPKADAYGFYGHHLYHGPPCKHAFVEETKEVCHIEPEKVCETKTRTYKVITGYEDGECKEIEFASSQVSITGRGPPSPMVTLSARRRLRRFARRNQSLRRSPRTSRSVTWSPRRCARRRPSRSPPWTARRRRRRMSRETLPMSPRNAIRVCATFKTATKLN